VVREGTQITTGNNKNVTDCCAQLEFRGEGGVNFSSGKRAEQDRNRPPVRERPDRTVKPGREEQGSHPLRKVARQRLGFGSHRTHQKELV